MIIALIIGLILGLIGTFGIMNEGTLAGLYSINSQILNATFVREIYTYTRYLALAIMILIIIIKGLNQWQLYRSGDPSASPTKIIISAIIGVIAIFAVLEFVKLMIDLSNAILHDLSQKDMSFGSMVSYSTDDQSIQVIDCIYRAIFSIAVFIIIYQVAYRTIELIGLTLLGPFFCINIVSDTRDIFMGWVKQVAGVALGHVYQYVLLLFLFFCIDELTRTIQFSGGDVTNFIMGALLRLASFVYVIRAPKAMQKLLFAGGADGGGGGVMSKMFYMRSILGSARSPKGGGGAL